MKIPVELTMWKVDISWDAFSQISFVMQLPNNVIETAHKE